LIKGERLDHHDIVIDIINELKIIEMNSVQIQVAEQKTSIKNTNVLPTYKNSK